MKLFLCEKPSQAKEIAHVLGAKKREEGYLSGNGIIVTWCVGHLLEEASPETYDNRYKKWAMDTLPIIPSTWKKVLKPNVKKQFNAIKKCLKQANNVVIATDPDREGEVIAWEVLEACGWKGEPQRLWLSALDETSIRNALSSMKSGRETYSLYQAGLGRSRADWLVGMNCTRLYTLLSQLSGKQGVLSVGRVQTPTLKLVVDRDNEIRQFIPKPYWRLDVRLAAQQLPFIATWQAPENVCDDADRCVNENALRQAAMKIQNGGQATVISVETKREKKSPPMPFSLSSLQKVCSTKWGFSAQEVLDIAQSLYEKHKATTYPRTDCTYLPESMLAEAKQVIAAMLQADPTLKSFASQLNIGQRSKCWNDTKITAHHAIIPALGTPNLSQMSDVELKVYDIIRRHYLAQFMPLYECDRTEAIFNASGETLVSRGVVDIVKGWKVLFAKSLDENDVGQTLPKLVQQQQCHVIETDIRALKTKPPAHFDDGSLIEAMKNAGKFATDERLKKILKETTGIGTEATRASVITTLVNRGYLVRQKKHLIASATAHELMSVLPAILVSPDMTALWEQALDDIALGKSTLASFMDKQGEFIRRLIANYG